MSTAAAAVASAFCTFGIATYRFAIDVLAVREVLRHQQLTPVPMAPADLAGLINLRGQLVTAIDLRVRLGLPPAPAGMAPTHLVLRDGDGAVSLMVDEVGEVRELAAAAHEAVPDALRGPARELTTGVFNLDTGLLLVLDVRKAMAARPPRR